MPLELAIVMPVFNEEACVARVVKSWIEAVRRETRSFSLTVLNDGSHDGTSAALHSVSEPELRVVDKQNEGHGPTILRGYRAAVEDADWVFQTDSDDEMPPDGFSSLWNKRKNCDMVFGARTNRSQPIARRIVSAGSRACVRAFCGYGVQDVNVPYRLMRSSCLKPMLSEIPPDTFAPNVAISGMALKRRLRVRNVPVPFRARATGRTTLVKWTLVRNSFISLCQTARILRK